MEQLKRCTSESDHNTIITYMGQPTIKMFTWYSRHKFTLNLNLNPFVFCPFKVVVTQNSGFGRVRG